MRLFKSIIFLFLMIGIFYSCEYDNLNIVPSDQTDSLVSYANDIHPMLVLYCYGIGGQRCHVTNTNQGSSGDFTTYAGVKAKVDNGQMVARAINSNGGMPPLYTNGPRPLDPADLDKLKRWIEMGAPEN